MHVSAPSGGHHEAAYFADLAVRFHGARRLSALITLIVEAADETFGCDQVAMTVLGARQRIESVAGPAAELVRAEQAAGTGPWWTAAGGQLTEAAGAIHAPITPGSGRPGGVLSLYPAEPTELRRVERFCTYAGIALEGTWYRERLQRSMETHTTVGSGIGMLMERHNIDRTAAYEAMSQLSIEQGIRLKEIAQRLREDSAK